jgi:hypothetical protein
MKEIQNSGSVKFKMRVLFYSVNKGEPNTVTTLLRTRVLVWRWRWHLDYIFMHAQCRGPLNPDL